MKRYIMLCVSVLAIGFASSSIMSQDQTQKETSETLDREKFFQEVEENDIDGVEVLLEKYPHFVEAVDPETGQSAIEVAEDQGYEDMADVLQDYLEQYGPTQNDIAKFFNYIESGSVETIQSWLENYPELVNTTSTKEYNTHFNDKYLRPAQLAIHLENKKMFNVLARYGATIIQEGKEIELKNVSQKNRNTMVDLFTFFKAIKNNDVKKLKTLQNPSRFINAKDPYAQSSPKKLPLQIAIENNKPALVDLLLRIGKGQRIQKLDSGHLLFSVVEGIREAPRDVQSQENNIIIAELLILHGATIYSKNIDLSPFIHANDYALSRFLSLFLGYSPKYEQDLARSKKAKDQLTINDVRLAPILNTILISVLPDLQDKNIEKAVQTLAKEAKFENNEHTVISASEIALGHGLISAARKILTSKSLQIQQGSEITVTPEMRGQIWLHAAALHHLGKLRDAQVYKLYQAAQGLGEGNYIDNVKQDMINAVRASRGKAFNIENKMYKEYGQPLLNFLKGKRKFDEVQDQAEDDAMQDDDEITGGRPVKAVKALSS